MIPSFSTFWPKCLFLDDGAPQVLITALCPRGCYPFETERTHLLMRPSRRARNPACRVYASVGDPHVCTVRRADSSIRPKRFPRKPLSKRFSRKPLKYNAHYNKMLYVRYHRLACFSRSLWLLNYTSKLPNVDELLPSCSCMIMHDITPAWTNYWGLFFPFCLIGGTTNRKRWLLGKPRRD